MTPLWWGSSLGGGGELSISSQVTARASRPPNFIFPSSPVRQWVLISRRTPARCSRPDNLTFSSLLLCEAYPSNTASIELPSDVGESFPARQTYFFDPAAFTLLSKPVRLGEPRSPDRRRREHSRPDNLAFSSPTLGEDYPSDTETLISHQTSARASQPDKLIFSVRSYHNIEPPSNSTYPIGQAILAFSPPPARLNQSLSFHLHLSDSESWSPFGRRRGAPGQTTLPFPSRGRRDLPIQTASIYLPSDVGESHTTTQLDLFRLYLSDTASLDLPSDAGEVLPARQPYLFKPLALWGLPFWHSEYWAPVRRRREPPS